MMQVVESGPEPFQWRPNTHQLVIMLILSIISFMVALDATIIVTTLNSIVESLSGTTTQGIWVGTAYLLSTSVTMPILASLSHIFGRPPLLVFSVAMFAIGTAICASSYSISQLLAGRSVQGIGSGGVVVISLVIFCDLVPLLQRPKWYGIIQGGWAFGTCIGPIVGGAIAQRTTWRWVFYIMFPFCIFGLVGIPLILTIQPRVENMGAKLHRVDWVGSFLFMFSTTSFLVAISWGGTEFAWSAAATVTPLVIGAIGFLAVAAWERFAAREPFMPHILFSSVSAIATYACSTAQGLLLFGQLYYVPFYFMSVQEYTPIRTGIALLPVMLILIPASIITGALTTRFNNYRWPIWSGWALCTVGCGLTTIWKDGTSSAVCIVTLVILGLGHGAILNAQNFAAQAICRSGEEASAAAMYAFMRYFGTALGVGIGGTTFQNLMALRLHQLGIPTDIARNAQAFLPELWAMPAGYGKDAIVAGYVSGFRGVFRLYLGISGVAFFLSLLIKSRSMTRRLQTEHRLHDPVWATNLFSPTEAAKTDENVAAS